MSNHTIGSFTRGGAYPCLILPNTSFLYHFIQQCDSVGLRPTRPSPPNQTPNTVLILQPCTHTHSMQCSRAYAMFSCICNAMRHCMLYHAICIMNATWTTQFTPHTRCHGQSHHMDMTSILNFIHVNVVKPQSD